MNEAEYQTQWMFDRAIWDFQMAVIAAVQGNCPDPGKALEDARWRFQQAMTAAWGLPGRTRREQTGPGV